MPCPRRAPGAGVTGRPRRARSAAGEIGTRAAIVPTPRPPLAAKGSGERPEAQGERFQALWQLQRLVAEQAELRRGPEHHLPPPEAHAVSAADRAKALIE